MDPAARRAEMSAEISRQTGIDDAMIRDLVHAFYARVRDDELLGPVFDARISDWGPHLEQMCDFWSSVALMTGRYHGQPMQKHLELPVDARHFDRWLHLFQTTALDRCPPAAADHFMERAQRIAQSMEMGIASYHGIMLGRSERLCRAELDTVDNH